MRPRRRRLGAGGRRAGGRVRPVPPGGVRHNIAPIFICPPNADDDLLRQIASYGRGYTYLLSRAGVTGAENRAALPLHHLVEKLAEYHAAPPLQGFGISAPEQVSAAIDAGAAGAISGSAIVKIIERHLDEPQTMLDELKAFVQSLKAATKTGADQPPGIAPGGDFPRVTFLSMSSCTPTHQTDR